MQLFLQLDFINFGHFSQWYINLTYFIITVLIFIFILIIFDKILSKILGNYNKPVKIRYLFFVCLVTSFITTFIS